MKTVDAAELSAYLDGELSPARKAEIDTILAADAELRAQFEALKATDLGWKTAAQSAMFEPEVSLPKPVRELLSPALLAVLFLTLLALRLTPKFTDILVFAVVLHSAALMILLPWLWKLVNRDANAPMPETN